MRRRVSVVLLTLAITAFLRFAFEAEEPILPEETAMLPSISEEEPARAVTGTLTISLPEHSDKPEPAPEEYLPEIPVSEELSIEAEEEMQYVEAVSIPSGTRTSLGEFVVTAYCDCVKCNGKWTGHKLNTPTQAGVPYPVEGYTISVDPEVIPLKSVVELDGWGPRYAQDTGSAIKGKRIDLFFNSHEVALEFGIKELEVWIYEP